MTNIEVGGNGTSRNDSLTPRSDLVLSEMTMSQFNFMVGLRNPGYLFKKKEEVFAMKATGKNKGDFRLEPDGNSVQVPKPEDFEGAVFWHNGELTYTDWKTFYKVFDLAEEYGKEKLAAGKLVRCRYKTLRAAMLVEDCKVIDQHGQVHDAKKGDVILCNMFGDFSYMDYLSVHECYEIIYS